MNKKQYISTTCLGLLLSLAILSPTAVQFTHIFEEHQHISCNDVTTHLHEKKVECSLCDFHFSTLDYQLQNGLDFASFHIIFSSERHPATTGKSHKTSQYYLRGPPLFS